MRRRPARPRGARLLGLCPLAAAEVFDLSAAEAPGPKALASFFTFYGRAITVAIEDLRYVPAPGQSYEGLRLVVAPKSALASLASEQADREAFCKESGAVGPEGHAVVRRITAAAASEQVEAKLVADEAVSLAIANCGDAPIDGLRISGRVSFSGEHCGHMQAIEHHKKTVNLWLSIFFIVLCMVWSVRLVCVWESLFAAHKVLGFALALATTEAMAGCFLANSMMMSDVRPAWLQPLHLLLSSCKTVVLVESIFYSAHKGTLPGLSVVDHAVLLLFALALFNYRWTVAKRAFYATSTGTILASAAGMVLCAAVVLLCGLLKANASILSLKEQRSFELANLLRTLQIVAIIGGCVGLAVTAMEVFDPTLDDPASWDMHPVFSESGAAVAHAVFVLVVVFVAWPSSGGAYRYDIAGDSPNKAGGDMVGVPATIWDDDDCEEDDLGPVQFGAVRPVQVAPVVE